MRVAIASAALAALVACSNGSGETPAATGGIASTVSGGTGGANPGGQPSSGGSNASSGGAMSSSGGQTGTSGSMAMAGASAGNSGGNPSSGGQIANGGTAPGGAAMGGSATGGQSGGQIANGGSKSSGGQVASGGAAAGMGGGAGASSSGGSGGASSCTATQAQENHALVSKALDELFVQKDITAVDRYWADPYYQHNPIAKSGVSTFRSLMSGVVSSGSFSYQRLRTVAECDLVVVQGRYSSTGVIFDMFRVKSGKIMEHWDSDTNQASDAAGPSEIQDSARTAENRARVLAFHQAVLVGGDTTQAASFFAADYSEHHSVSGQSGSAAFLEYLSGNQVTYAKAHHVIAMGNFVFVLSEGARRGAAMGFYDLFRLADGNLAEHWDSARSVPNSTTSGLPIF